MRSLGETRVKLALWWAETLPYVERAFAGQRLRGIMILAMAIWMGTAAVAFFAVTDASDTGRELRNSLRLEPRNFSRVQWEQCGFCLTPTQESEVRSLREEIGAMSYERIQACRGSQEYDACEYVSYKYARLLRSLPSSTDSLATASFMQAFNAKSEGWEPGVPSLREVYDAALAQNFRPHVEKYRSPFGLADFPRAWGIICSVVLLVICVVVVPVRLAFVLGTHLYHQTWRLLVATQRPVKQIGFALCFQALAAVAVVAAPLWLTSTLALLWGGSPMVALSFTLFAVTLALVWAAFGATLPALAGRHVPPAMLVLIGLLPPLAYFMLVFNLDPSELRNASMILRRVVFHSGFDFWRNAQYGFDALGFGDHAPESPHWARLLASLALSVASLFWIGAQVGRFQASRRASLSRARWVGLWGLAGMIVGLRWYAGVALLMAEGHWSRWTRFEEAGSVLWWLLPIPAFAYLVSPLHPLSQRPEARLSRHAWGTLWRSSLLAMVGFLVGFLLIMGRTLAPLLADIPPREAIFSAFLLVQWSLLLSGVSTVFAKGLSGFKARAIFVSLGGLALALCPGMGYNLVDQTFDRGYCAGFCSPGYWVFQVLLYLFILLAVARWIGGEKKAGGR